MEARTHLVIDVVSSEGFVNVAHASSASSQTMSLPCPTCMLAVSTGAWFHYIQAITELLHFLPGILFGSMVFELGDTSAATNEATDLSCEVLFKTKVGVMGVGFLRSKRYFR